MQKRREPTDGRGVRGKGKRIKKQLRYVTCVSQLSTRIIKNKIVLWRDREEYYVEQKKPDTRVSDLQT